MLKRFSLSGWEPILVNKTSRTHKNSVSRHAQFYVSQMLGFIAENYDQALTINDVADIALTAGFRSSSRFYSTFGKYVGMSPQQYRKLSQQRRQTFPG